MVYSGTTFKGTPSGEIVASQFTRESLGDTDVLVRITHSGLCGTDLHVLASGIALGHEGSSQHLCPSCIHLTFTNRRWRCSRNRFGLHKIQDRRPSWLGVHPPDMRLLQTMPDRQRAVLRK